MATNNTSNVCTICVEKYHRGYRPPVQCTYCAFESCTSCIQNYLLSINEHAKCMNCAKPWSKEFIDANLSKKFRTGAYKTHYENILFEKERMMFPECQYIIEESKVFDSTIKELRTEYEELDAKMVELHNQMTRLHVSKRQLLRGDTSVSVSKSKKKLIRPCPACNGFLADDYKCGICETKVCEHCFVVLENEHECKQEDIDTAKEIKSSCKNCPNCGVSTFKIDGCDQMYCLHCHTAWSWNTELIETGKIHNPHYYEWLREQNNGEIPREQGDELCGGFPTISELLEPKGILYAEDIQDNEALKEIRSTVVAIWRCIGNANTSKRRYFHQDSPNENLDLRLAFIQNAITVDVFKAELERRDKVKTKRMEIYQILDTLSIVGTEAIKKYQNNNDDDAVENLLIEMMQLKEFINSSFVKLKKRFGTSMPNINDKWEFKAPRVA